MLQWIIPLKYQNCATEAQFLMWFLLLDGCNGVFMTSNTSIYTLLWSMPHIHWVQCSIFKSKQSENRKKRNIDKFICITQMMKLMELNLLPPIKVSAIESCHSFFLFLLFCICFLCEQTVSENQSSQIRSETPLVFHLNSYNNCVYVVYTNKWKFMFP